MKSIKVKSMLLIACVALAVGAGACKDDKGKFRFISIGGGGVFAYWGSWVTDGSVAAIEIAGQTLYAGGSFSQVWANSGGGAILAADTGVIAPKTRVPYINGTVLAAAPDGDGGWYIGGTFTKIGETTRNRIARINSNGTLHAWDPNANGIVSALAVSGGTVYAGGDFTHIGSDGGEDRGRVAALRSDSGAAVAGFNSTPGANGQVHVIAVADGYLYLGGDFTQYDGAGQLYIAKINAATGARVAAFNGDANDRVNAIVPYRGKLYVGGAFNAGISTPSIGGESLDYLAVLSDDDGTAAADWNPDPDGAVYGLSLYGNTLYVGGGFNLVGTTVGRAALASYSLNDDPAQIALTSWNPGANQTVRAILATGSAVYVGGDFFLAGTENRSRIASVHPTTGAVNEFDPTADNIVQALSLSRGKLYAGGSFTGINVRDRGGMASFDLSTGVINEDFNPDVTGVVHSIEASDTAVYLGGGFTDISGFTRNNIAMVNPLTGNPDPDFNPNANGEVRALQLYEETLLVGGDFNGDSTIGGGNCDYLAVLDGISGLSVGADSGLNDSVYALSVYGRRAYAGGEFADLLSGINPVTGVATSHPAMTGTLVWAIAATKRTVYAGGEFTAPHTNIAAFNASDNSLLAWNPTPNPNNLVYAMDARDNILYAAGEFTTIGDVTTSVAAIDEDGIVDSTWKPVANSRTRALKVYGNLVFIGGDFTTINGISCQSLAGIETGTGKVFGY